ncbi:alpha/beta fold hydrolase [Herbiconiux daphne]|uniref:Alpha/beta hydrolase n=1 Tax=Herbiconiux daphne TaxID=2970914 RepID=A0ABT2GYG1_9MICO|nr:alpha/beta hydrolase [Herbiconiux daphne]MCS5732958.1 alpha/beta hydrolase [Herbiconiux daphne]
MTDYTTSSRGDRVAYDVRGDGPALVFVTGAGADRAGDPVLTRTAELAASRGLTTLTFDRLGRGESRDVADGPLDLDRELEALRAVIDVAGSLAVLCGHSSGCAIALRAADAGLPVMGLALWEGPLAAAAAATREWRDEFERRLDSGDLAAAQEQYMRDMPPEWLEGAKNSGAWESIIAGAPALRADAQALVWATAALENGGLGGIRVPVLAMYAEQTFPGMFEAAERVALAVSTTTVREMPGAHHTWEPESMAAELAEFVRACAATD